jgi:hypothetical protein
MPSVLGTANAASYSANGQKAIHHLAVALTAALWALGKRLVVGVVEGEAA